MPLKLAQLRIENFKCFRDATFEWDPTANVLTGRNNSGKTTVLEAIALWAELFERAAFQAGKASRKSGVRRGEWRLAPSYLLWDEVSSVRQPGYRDLFFEGAEALTITGTLQASTGRVDVGLRLAQARGGLYHVQPRGDPAKLNALIRAWPRPFRVHFASPVAAVHAVEEFRTRPGVAQLVKERRSAEVLRNRIFAMSGTGRLGSFQDDVSLILTGSLGQFRLHLGPASDESVQARVEAQLGRRGGARDLSLLGSGTLQVMEALLGAYEDSRDMHLLLLDEPDSHIHRDIQVRLLQALERHGDHVQTFLTTHNEALIRSSRWDRVFHLGDDPSVAGQKVRPVTAALSDGPKRGFQPTPVAPVLASVGGETALDLLSALEADHLLLVEGRDDAALVQRILELDQVGAPPRRAAYWALDGIDHGLRALPHLFPILRGIRNQRSLAERAVVVLDRDLLTDAQAQTLEVEGERRYKARFFMWDGAACAEATVLDLARARGLVERLADEAGLDLHPDARMALTAECWDLLRERIRERIFKTTAAEMQGRLVQRQQAFAAADLRGVLEGSPAALFDGWRAWSLAKVEAGALSAVATKDEVGWFFWSATRGTAVAPEDAHGLERYLAGRWWADAVRQAHRDTFFPAWDQLLQLLRAPRAP